MFGLDPDVLPLAMLADIELMGQIQLGPKIPSGPFCCMNDDESEILNLKFWQFLFLKQFCVES